MSKLAFLPLGLLLAGVSLGTGPDAVARALHGGPSDGDTRHTHAVAEPIRSGQIPKLWRQASTNRTNKEVRLAASKPSSGGNINL
jgi:hypothetical protein